MRFLWIVILFINSLSGQDFQNRAMELGVDHVTLSPHGMAGGISVFDFNNDGWLDLYFTGGTSADHLFQNNGNGSFTDVSDSTGISVIADRYTMGVVAGDIDNDGFEDLYITTFKGEKDILLKNIHGERFEDIADEGGIMGSKWTASATLGDLDQDGDLDVFVSNYVDFLGTPFHQNITNSEPNQIYENLGDGRFELRDSLLKFGHDGCTLATAFTDVNKDLRPDLFVINDFGASFGANELYLNAGDTLVEVGESTGAAAEMNGMGIAIGDFNQDGYFDYYLTNIRDNILYVNNDQSILNDVSDQFNVNDGLPHYAWGTFFADMNNDANLDLFVGKGALRGSGGPEENKFYEYYPITGNFADVTNLKGLNDGSRARGVAYGDLNNDGKLDIVISNVKVDLQNTGRAAIYMNEGIGGDFLTLDLEGVISNRSAIGTRIELYTDEKMMMREVTGGGSYLSNHSYVQHFGLGGGTIDSMVIHWPSGIKQQFVDLMKNTAYSLVEGEELTYEGQEKDSTSSTQIMSIPLDIKVYPNPAGETVTLSSESINFQSADLALFDGRGNKATLTYTLLEKQIHIDTRALPPGIYFLQVFTKRDRFTEKIRVIH